MSSIHIIIILNEHKNNYFVHTTELLVSFVKKTDIVQIKEET